MPPYNCNRGIENHTIDSKEAASEYTTSPISPIIHFVCHQKFCIDIVFNFSWDLLLSREKLCLGKEGQTKCIMENVEVANQGSP